ncbi:hypothetical protein QF031_002891 [Pseudarthrobacter defluvii]|uniref:hypothetical protein n=1 Tax=Pseudarthrobacter defluvii TaxID=410837 RepID=UPI0027885734|nr:hypothetical protein [Pseudarthrobacter defluvii]MDQ0770142.1 hypothetical protein [Pseudarthrobacter defluvii]
MRLVDSVNLGQRDRTVRLAAELCGGALAGHSSPFWALPSNPTLTTSATPPLDARNVLDEAAWQEEDWVVRGLGTSTVALEGVAAGR